MSATTRPGRLISADSHVNEPPDLWVERVPAALRDRAPRMEHFAEGDAWVIEGVADPINFGMNACAGLEPEQQRIRSTSILLPRNVPFAEGAREAMTARPGTPLVSI